MVAVERTMVAGPWNNVGAPPVHLPAWEGFCSGGIPSGIESKAIRVAPKKQGFQHPLAHMFLYGQRDDVTDIQYQYHQPGGDQALTGANLHTGRG